MVFTVKIQFGFYITFIKNFIQFDIQIILFMVIKMTKFFNALNIIIIYIIQLNSLMNGFLATKVVEP